MAEFNLITNKPTHMVRIITTSPLARIFHPYADISPFLEDPSKLFDKDADKDFEVMIQSSWASKTFITGKPYLIDSGEALALVGVDNGRLSQDRAGTGLVYFNVSEDVEAALEYTKKTKHGLPLDMKAKLDKEMVTIKKLSHDRVVGHCKRLYNSLIASRNKIKESGAQPEAPNDMELLVAYVLKEEVQKSKAKRAALTAAFEETADVMGEEANALL